MSRKYSYTLSPEPTEESQFFCKDGSYRQRNSRGLFQKQEKEDSSLGSGSGSSSIGCTSLVDDGKNEDDVFWWEFLEQFQDKDSTSRPTNLDASFEFEPRKFAAEASVQTSGEHICEGALDPESQPGANELGGPLTDSNVRDDASTAKNDSGARASGLYRSRANNKSLNITDDISGYGEVKYIKKDDSTGNVYKCNSIDSELAVSSTNHRNSATFDEVNTNGRGSRNVDIDHHSIDCRYKNVSTNGKCTHKVDSVHDSVDGRDRNANGKGTAIVSSVLDGTEDRRESVCAVYDGSSFEEGRDDEKEEKEDGAQHPGSEEELVVDRIQVFQMVWMLMRFLRLSGATLEVRTIT